MITPKRITSGGAHLLSLASAAEAQLELAETLGFAQWRSTTNELWQNMKYCMEITCVFGSQQQNDMVNLIASIDTF